VQRRPPETHDAYNNVAKPRLVMALTAVEQSLYSTKSDIVAIPSSLSLEHLIPQAWEENWPIPTGLTQEEEQVALETRERAVHRLGNLTLVAGGLNSSLSNETWMKKQRGLNAESRLLLNARLIEEHPERLDEVAVAERTAWLVTRFCEIWPGPEHDWLGQDQAGLGAGAHASQSPEGLRPPEAST
jgi:hypothetical protein